MISKIITLCKDTWTQMDERKNDFFIAAIIILVAIIGFGLGRLSVIYENQTPITAEYSDIEQYAKIQNTFGQIKTTAGHTELYVASQNSDKYHFPWCAGAQRIKEENKIWFSSAEEARKAGYTPAGNCEGLE